jgi:hypothetical protein
MCHTLIGTLYVTPTAVCIASSSGLLTMRQNKEIFPLSALHEVLLPAQWLARHTDGTHSGASSGSMFSSNTLMLVFFKPTVTTPGPGARASSGSREVLVSPMLLDCTKLRHVLLEVKAAFAQVR